MSFNLKSAREVLGIVSGNTALKNHALEYARQKADDLNRRGKSMRARLWQKTIDELQKLSDQAAQKTANTNVKKPVKKLDDDGAFCKNTNRDEYRKKRGMIKKKVCGATVWGWPTKSYKRSYGPKPKACPVQMERAYKAWKEGNPLEYCSVYF